MSRFKSRLCRLVCFGAGLLAVGAAGGCGPGRPPRVPAPALDPVAIVAAAGDLDKLPSIAAGRPVLDTDHDMRVSESELLAWFERVRRSKVALVSVSLRVRHKGRPLANADVRLVPERCMGGTISEASGKTDRGGMGMVAIPGSKFPGVNCGLYRVQITGTGNDGQALPARYNSESVLGIAVGGGLPENGAAIFDLD